MKLFQIYEDDLETLERVLPELLSDAQSSPYWNENKCLQEGWDMVKKVVANVRWNYGPPSHVEKIE